MPCLISFVGEKLSDIYLSLSTVRLIFALNFALSFFKTKLKIYISSSKIRTQFVRFVKILVTLNLSVWLPCLISFVGGKLSDIYLSLSTVRLIFDTKKNLVNTACWALPKQVFGFVYHQGITQQCFIFCPNSS